MTRQKKIKLFTKYVNHYFHDIFKLTDYELLIHEQDKISARASTYSHPIEDGANMVTICYSIDWIDKKDLEEIEIEKVAFHEVCETLLLKMCELAKCRYIMEREITETTHYIIRKLENIFFENGKKLKSIPRI